jgi:hypothetical protein
VARPRQPKTSSAHYEPDIDVDQFHAATDSMARIVQRVRGETPPPAPQSRPRRRARRHRVEFHPAAAAQRNIKGLARPKVSRDALKRAERRPPRSRRPLLFVGVGALVLAAAVALAVTAPPPDEAVRAGPERETAPGTGGTDEPGTTTTTTSRPTTTTTEPPAATVEYPAPGVVAITAPAAELVIEATDICWLGVSTDGGPTNSLVLEPGDRQRFEAEERIEVRVGNPPALDVRVAGDPVDLGDHGGQPVDLVVTVAG